MNVNITRTLVVVSIAIWGVVFYRAAFEVELAGFAALRADVEVAVRGGVLAVRARGAVEPGLAVWTGESHDPPQKKKWPPFLRPEGAKPDYLNLFFSLAAHLQFNRRGGA